jgi:hypothetical protein
MYTVDLNVKHNKSLMIKGPSWQATLGLKLTIV